MGGEGGEKRDSWQSREGFLASNEQVANATSAPEEVCILLRTISSQARWVSRVGIRDETQGLGHSLGGQQHILSGMQVTGVRVLPVQILRNSFGRKLCFADVSKIPS